MKKILFIAFLLLCFPVWVYAATSYTAASCQNDAAPNDIIQQAIASCVADGDCTTVYVPAGNCTITNDIDIPDTKAINLVGAGSGTDGTVITYGTGIYGVQAEGDDWTVSGFRFLTSVSTSLSAINAHGLRWRIHHNYFGHTTPGIGTRGNTQGIGANGTSDGISGQHTTGLIDNNTFDDIRIVVEGEGTFATQNTLWTQANAFGTFDCVYVENNTFNRLSGNVIDSNRASKYVFRFNNVNQVDSGDANYPVPFMAHSLQDADERGSKTWEIYNNKIVFIDEKSYALASMRGGTGMFYDNDLTATRADVIIALDNVRSDTCAACGSNPPPATTDSGLCDGTSLWDGNEVGGSGYPCRDQIGTGQDSALFNTTDYGAAPVKSPAYFWNNTKNGVTDMPPTVDADGRNTTHIQSGRDYFTATTYDGLAQKPTGYSAYTCPHPLAGLTGSCNSTAGTGGYNVAAGSKSTAQYQSGGMTVMYQAGGGTVK